MKRPQEHEYTSHVAYSRALEAYCNLLEQPAQDEPVAWVERDGELVWNDKAAAIGRNLYTRPQQPAQDEQQKAPPEQWSERWYGSGAERGWWIVCGREHIAHLGPSEFAEVAARKIVDAHNRYKPAALQKEPAQDEPVAHSIVAGALFDFMGWLTSRKERIVLSSADNASPAVEAITEFAKMRNLSLDDANVQDWNTTPPHRKPLTDEEIWNLAANCLDSVAGRLQFARAIEAAHGIKGEA